MGQSHSTTSNVYVAIRASSQTGLFDLVTISDTFGSPEDAIRMLDMTQVEQLSTHFWPEQSWRERLNMLKRVSPTGQEQWLAAQEIALERR